MTVNVKLSAIALLAMMISLMIPLGQARAGALTDAEATFLAELVTAAAVVEQRCTGYEANGAGAVQVGTRLLGSPDAAMAMVNAFDAAIKALDGNAYDAGKFRSEVTSAAGGIFKRVRADLIRNPNAACADYGDTAVAHGLLRRY
jgi:hypothetical protein